MPRLDEYPFDPEVAAALDAIDATLAGDPVDPEHAELAELALLLVAERPQIDDEFARSLDQRVARRFAPAHAPAASSAPAPRRGWSWLWKPAVGTLGAVLAAVLFVAGVNSVGGGGASSSSSSSTAASATAASAGPGRQLGIPAAKPAPANRESAAAGTSSSAAAASTTAAASSSSAASAPSAAAASGNPAPHPQSNGRKIVQSAQLTLTSAPNRVDTVAQEVFDVVGRENGVVNRSTVTATGATDGYAEFQLRVPSSSLADTMNALSQLRYAHVSARTDNTQDVNGAYVSVTHQLADARALRTALLKQLATAVTQAQIDSINARIQDAEAAIARAEATIRGLNQRVNFSQISLDINAANVPAAVPHHSGSFGLGRAAHDAGRVLTVAAGVALISLAALLPVALVGAVIWWIAAAVRHRRREQALDAA
jgi:hypothetical protein